MATTTCILYHPSQVMKEGERARKQNLLEKKVKLETGFVVFSLKDLRVTSTNAAVLKLFLNLNLILI